eukprot:9471957-Pyramimonas_sp.AAC.1
MCSRIKPKTHAPPKTLKPTLRSSTPTKVRSVGWKELALSRLAQARGGVPALHTIRAPHFALWEGGGLGTLAGLKHLTSLDLTQCHPVTAEQIRALA